MLSTFFFVFLLSWKVSSVPSSFKLLACKGPHFSCFSYYLPSTLRIIFSSTPGAAGEQAGTEPGLRTGPVCTAKFEKAAGVNGNAFLICRLTGARLHNQSSELWSIHVPSEGCHKTLAM